jgi:Ca2+-binding EF-hand superfamily protein
MGCIFSQQTAVYSDPRIAPFREVFEELGIDENCAQKLYNIFRKSDISNDGSISDTEILMLLDMDRTPYTERIFKVFDSDGSGQITFSEFVFSVWNYCSLDMSYLPWFSFSLYDIDGGGEIAGLEIEHMLKDIYGDNIGNNPIAQDLLKVQIPKYTANHKVIKVGEFVELIKRYPKFLFPAFQVVEKLQKVTLGTSFWDEIIVKRKQLSGGKYKKFEEFLDRPIPKEEDIERELKMKKRQEGSSKQSS